MHNEFFASGRMDNLSSVHASLVAMIEHAATGSGEHIALFAAFDHEEIGSESRSGACGPFLQDVLERIGHGLGATLEDRNRAYADSFCLSADAGHSVHPNYPGHHDPANRPLLGAGPLLKINANQRYATDAVGAALFATLCKQAGVPYQEFVSNNQMPCGSTIGPLTATRLGIRTVDVGIPLFQCTRPASCAALRTHCAWPRSPPGSSRPKPGAPGGSRGRLDPVNAWGSSCSTGWARSTATVTSGS